MNDKNYEAKKFSTRDEAVEYLAKKINLSEKECSNAYEILVKIDFSKNIE